MQEYKRLLQSLTISLLRKQSKLRSHNRNLVGIYYMKTIPSWSTNRLDKLQFDCHLDSSFQQDN
jgi:hypothetical protein